MPLPFDNNCVFCVCCFCVHTDLDMNVQLFTTFCVRVSTCMCESAAVRWLVSLHWAQQCDSWAISHATSCRIHHSTDSKVPMLHMMQI